MTKTMAGILVVFGLAACGGGTTGASNGFTGKSVAEMNAIFGPASKLNEDQAVWEIRSFTRQGGVIEGVDSNVQGYRSDLVEQTCTVTSKLSDGRVVSTNMRGKGCAIAETATEVNEPSDF